MKIVPAGQAKVFANAFSEAREYALGDKDIDCALVRIIGEYPGYGKFAVNTKCKELLFVIEGDGIIETKCGTAKSFSLHDVLLIESGEAYRFKGGALFAIVCAPP